jgi:predicted MFS family arabinose efflux permease
MGYHTYLQTNHALGMSLTTERRTGSILGRLSAIGSAGSLAAMLVVLLGFQFKVLDFQPTFVLAGIMALIAAIAIASFPILKDGKVDLNAPRRDPIVLTKDYRYYYLLNLLDGGRQQIFFSFGLWVLVHQFSLGVPLISGVLFCTTTLVMLTGPRIGRLIDQHGERQVLAWVNIAYIVALVGYGLSPNVYIAIFCYVVYTFIFPLSNIGAATYLRKIAVHREIAPSLAMGLTMQHVAAVAVPLATGYILNFVGYQIPFLVAAVFAALTIIVTRRLDPANQKSPRRIAEEARQQAVTSPANPSPAGSGQPAQAPASGGGD